MQAPFAEIYNICSAINRLYATLSLSGNTERSSSHLVTTMKLMINGTWHGDIDPTPKLDAQRMIHAGTFRDRVTADGSSGFAAKAGRYHLYVSYACPFSHRVIMVRALKRLQSVVGLSVLHPLWDTPDGWIFGDTSLSTPDGGGSGFIRLHEAYRASRSDYTGKIIVPVLWDQETRRIISNESLEIAEMLNDAFDGVGGDRQLDLYPAALRSEIDALNRQITRDLAKGVYAVAAARDQGEYDEAMHALFSFLDALEHQLSDRRSFLLGERVTLADVLAFASLVRFDAVYNPLFRASRRRLVDYLCLSAFMRRVHDLPGVAETVRFDHILMHYYDGDWAVATRRGIVPQPPATDWRCSSQALGAGVRSS
jgi:putative glutathione S-transferase